MSQHHLHGSCHCGRLSLTFSTRIAPESFSPRTCDCSFCTRHGAAYISDPEGSLVIESREADAIGRYMFGDGLAKFLLCTHCGVLVAVLFESEGRTFASVNSRCITDASFGVPQVASPQQLDAAQKRERWTRLMIPDVELRVAA
jgi:hypothetical protein